VAGATSGALPIEIAKDKELVACGIPRSPVRHLGVPICLWSIYYKGVRFYVTPLTVSLSLLSFLAPAA
jgi:hypothetical protein